MFLQQAVLNPVQGFLHVILFYKLGGLYCYVITWLENNPTRLDLRLDEFDESSALLSFKQEEA